MAAFVDIVNLTNNLQEFNSKVVKPEINTAVASAGVSISSAIGNAIIEKSDGLYVGATSANISSADGNQIVQKSDGIFVAATDISGKVDKEDGKGLSTNDYTSAEKTKLADIETGANKTEVDESLSTTSTNPVQNQAITNAMGSANGFATLDANGKLPTSQMPTTAEQIVGEFDAEDNHTLPDISNYDSGNELIVVTDGYYIQSTAFTLTAGNTLTEMEVAQANKLIANSYVFTLKNGDTVLGTVKTFATDKVTLSDDTEISLPYASNLSATSDPSVVQITVKIGDKIMNIDDHWVHLSNTSTVTSVNGKGGAVTLTASDIGAVAADNVVTAFSESLSDTKIPSEKLVKNTIDNSEWTGTKAEWNALTTDEKAVYDGKKVNITDDYSEYITTDTFSTTETKTNGVWIDNKPIYRKVFNLGSVYTEGWSNAEGLSNIDTIIDIKGIAVVSLDDGAYYPIADINRTTLANGWGVRVSSDKTALQVYKKGSAVDNCIVILEYTKTTD